MLEAVLREIRHRQPSAVVSIPEGMCRRNVPWCNRNNIVPLYRTDGCRRFVRAWIAIIRSRLYKSPQPMIPSEVDLLLDASGFRYSDQFGERTDKMNRDELSYYRSFRCKSRKIVLLPQAFGPFTDASQRKRLLGEFVYFDRVYVRDAASWRYVVELISPSGKLKRGKDFTCLLECESKFHDIKNRYAVVIVNKKMVDATDCSVSTNYLDFMLAIIEHIIGLQMSVVLLNHGGIKDAAMNDYLAGKFRRVVSVINDASAKECKRIIGGADMLVSSRFHGAVSGLVQGVPTLCTSWSHKYEELFGDFGLTKNCLRVTEIEASLAKIDDVLSNPCAYSASKEAIRQYHDDAIEMWNEIFSMVAKEKGVGV